MSSGAAAPSVSDILSRYAEGAGLSAELRRFPLEGSMHERLAGNPLIMAPMAGVSDAAYRIMARSGGAALAYSEMVSVAGLHYGSDKTWDLVVPHAVEPDIAVQLFGSEPQQFEEAATAVARRLGDRLVLLDVNMACPVPKVTKGGAGSALLDDAQRSAEIVRACHAGLDTVRSGVPVTVKIRRGRRMDEEVAPEFAMAMEAAGTAAIAVHGRFANQMYRGEADWGCVERVVQAVKIPVVGSGDVYTYDDAQRMQDVTGCAAVMIARGTYGNPWVFSGRVPTSTERIEAFSTHVRLLDATGAHMARARSLAGWYFKGMPGAAMWRRRAMECVTAGDFLRLSQQIQA